MTKYWVFNPCFIDNFLKWHNICHRGNFTVYRTVVSTLGITKYIRHQNIIKERETDHVIGHWRYLGTVQCKVPRFTISMKLNFYLHKLWVWNKTVSSQFCIFAHILLHVKFVNILKYSNKKTVLHFNTKRKLTLEFKQWIDWRSTATPAFIKH